MGRLTHNVLLSFAQFEREVTAEQNGIATKQQLRSDGSTRSGGKSFSRGNLHALLRYRTYIGEVQHQGKVYPGEQEAIIPAEVWHQVQARLLEGRSSDISIRHEGVAPALTGLVFDETAIVSPPPMPRRTDAAITTTSPRD